MKTTLSEREGNTVKLAVEVSSEELQEAFDKPLKQLAREVRIPGFRPGKAPPTMVRQRLGDEAILADTVEESMDGWFAAAVVELGLDPVDRPEIDWTSELPELGKPLRLHGHGHGHARGGSGRVQGPGSAQGKPPRCRTRRSMLRWSGCATSSPNCARSSGRAVQKGDFVTADFRATARRRAGGRLSTPSDFVFEVGAGASVPRDRRAGSWA